MDSSFEAKATAQRSKQPLVVNETNSRWSLRRAAGVAIELLGTVWRLIYLTSVFGPVCMASFVFLGNDRLRSLWMRWFRFSLEVQCSPRLERSLCPTTHQKPYPVFFPQKILTLLDRPLLHAVALRFPALVRGSSGDFAVSQFTPTD